MKQSLIQPIEPLCVSVDTAAALLGVSRNLVYNLINGGELKAVPMGAKRKVIELTELRRWVEATATGGLTAQEYIELVSEKIQARTGRPTKRGKR